MWSVDLVLCVGVGVGVTGAGVLFGRLVKMPLELCQNNMLMLRFRDV